MPKRDRFELRSDRTPMENLWICVQQASEAMIASKHLSLTDDEYSDLLYDLMTCTFIRFKGRVLRGQYNRKYPLFTNVYGCAWGCWSPTWYRHSRDIKRRINTTSLDKQLAGKSINMYEALPDENQYKLCSSYKYEEIEECLNLPNQRDRAYCKYLEDCYEFGVEPMSLEDFVVNNGGKKEWASPDWTEQDSKNEQAREKRRLAREMQEEERKAADIIKSRLKGAWGQSELPTA